MNNDLRILLGVAINAEQAIKSLNTQIAQLSQKVDSIKLNIGIDDKVLSQLAKLTSATNTVKNATDNLNKVIKQEETVIKNLDGSIDKLIRQTLASGEIVEKTRQTIDKSRQSKEADVAATIKLIEVEDQYGKKLKEIQRLDAQNHKTGSSTTYGNKYKQTTVSTNADGLITNSKVVQNIQRQEKDIEKVEQQHNEQLRKIAHERTQIKIQLQTLDNSTGKVTDFQKNDINRSLYSSKSMEDIQKVKDKMSQIESSIKAQIQYQNEQNKVLAQQYQEAQKIAEKEAIRVQNLGQRVNSNINSNTFTGDYAQAKTNIEKYIQSVYGANTAVSNLQRVTNSAGQEVWKFTANIKNAEKETEVIKGSIDKTTASMYEMSRSTKQAGEQMTAFDRFTTALRTIPAWLGATTLIFGTINAFKQMTQTIVDVDSAMTNLKKVMNLDTNFDEVMDSAIQKSQEFAKTITDTLNAFEVFARQGFNQSQIDDMANATLIASNVGEIKSADAAGYLTSAIIQFKLQTKDAISVVDAWNNISNKNATTVENLAQGVAKAGATARSFGLDMNQLNAIIGTVTATTKQSGTEVGNFVKSVLPRLMSSDAQKALQSIGVASTDKNGDLRNAVDIYADVAKQFDKLTVSQRNMIAESLAGKFQISRMTALLSNWDMYEKQLTDSINSKNSAMNENAVYMQSMQAKIELLKGSFQQLALAVGGAFLSDGFVAVVQMLTAMAQGAAVLVKSIGALPVIFATASTATLIFNTSLRTAVVSSRVATTAFALLGVTARTTQAILATTGVGLALVAVGIVLEKIISYWGKVNQQAQQAEAQAKRYSDASQDAILNESDKLNGLIEQYKELSSKKQAEGLSTEENKKYLQIQQDLSQLFPNLISYIDSKGQAHLKEAEDIDKVIESTKEMIQLKKDEAKLDAQENFKKSKDNIDDIKNQISAKESDLKVYENLGNNAALKSSREKAKKQANEVEQEIAILKNKLSIAEKGVNQEVLKISDAFSNIDVKVDPTVKQKVSDLVMSLDIPKDVVKNGDALEQTSKLISKAMEDINTAVNEKDANKLQSIIDKLKKNLESIGIKDDSLKDFNISLDDISKSMDDTGKQAENLAERISSAMEAGVDPTDMLSQAVKDAKGDFDKLSEAVVAYAKAGKDSEAIALAQGDAYKALSDEISPLNELLEKMAEGKSLSAAEAMDLIAKEGDLANAISVENGVVKINQDAVLKLRDAKVASYQDMINATKKEVQAQAEALKIKLKNYGVEIQGIMSVAQANEALALATKKNAEAMQKINSSNDPGAMHASEVTYNQYNDVVSGISDIKTAYEQLDKLSSLASSGLTQVGTSAEKLSDSSDKANKSTKESIYISDKYKLSLDAINAALDKQRAIKQKFPQYSKEYQNALKAEINLLKEQKQLVDNQAKSLQSQIASGNIARTGIVDVGSTVYSTGGLTVSNGDVRNISNVSASDLNRYLKGKLSGMGEALIEAGKANGIDPAFLAAIAMHESGNGTSNAIRNKNNAFGIMSSSGGLRSFSSLTENIRYEADMLRRLYINQGLTTVAEIQKKYAPVGAANDPNGLNRDWLNGVTSFWNKFTNTITSVATSAGDKVSSSVTDYYLNNFRVTSPFGEKRGNEVHKGVDFANGRQGDLVKAIGSGKVITATYSKSAGNWVVVQQDDGLVAKYMHMQNGSLAVKAGDRISAGQTLGKVGSTGDSTGAHLHLQLESNGKAIDPLNYLKTHNTQDFSQSVAEANQAIDQAKSDVLSLQQDSQQIQQQIQDLYLEIVNANVAAIDHVKKAYDAKLSQLTFVQNTLDEHSRDWMSTQISLEGVMKNQIDTEQESIKYLQNEIKYNKQLTAAQKATLGDQVLDRQNELISLEQKLYDTRVQMANEVVDTYKKALETQRDASVKVIDDMIDKINKSADDADYQKKLTDAQKSRQEIQDEINKLSLDTSSSAQKRKDDLLKQLAEQDDSISQMQSDRSKQLRLDNLNKQKDSITNYYDNILNDEQKFSKMRSDIINVNNKTIAGDLWKMELSIRKNGTILGVNLVNGMIDAINRSIGYLHFSDWGGLKPVKPISLDTGGFTGSWGSEGRMAMLHEKELVLNKNDTKNVLSIVDMVRSLASKIPLPNFGLNSLAPSPTLSGGGNTYNINLNIDKLNGDVNGGKTVFSTFVNELRKRGGDI